MAPPKPPIVLQKLSKSINTQKITPVPRRRKVTMKKSQQVPYRRHISFCKLNNERFQKADLPGSLTSTDDAAVDVVDVGILETIPSLKGCPTRVLGENTSNNENLNSNPKNDNDGLLKSINDDVSTGLKFEAGGNESMTGEMIDEMVEEMMNEEEEADDDDEVEGGNEFLADLARALLQLDTNSSCYYTSLLVMEDEDEPLVENRGLGVFYFNPYDDDWSFSCAHAFGSI